MSSEDIVQPVRALAHGWPPPTFSAIPMRSRSSGASSAQPLLLANCLTLRKQNASFLQNISTTPSSALREELRCFVHKDSYLPLGLTCPLICFLHIIYLFHIVLLFYLSPHTDVYSILPTFACDSTICNSGYMYLYLYYSIQV